MKTIKHLSVTFDIPLPAYQIKHFRGAIVEALGREHDLFHNHQEKEGYHYRYPLIQYKTQRRKAGILGLGKGAEALYYLLTTGIAHLTFDGQTHPLRLAHLQQKDIVLNVLNQPKTYRLYHYVGLNVDNYERWKSMSNYADKVALLERVLTAHILSFAAGVGWDIQQQFEVRLENINGTKRINYKDTELMAFDLDFNVPLYLPRDIGLGKSVSMGFGKLLPLHLQSKGGKGRLIEKSKSFKK